MKRIILVTALSITATFIYQNAAMGQSSTPCLPSDNGILTSVTDSLSENLDWPDDLTITVFSGPELTPSPAALGVAPTGEVYAGVDMQGSLGKEMGRGKIVRLVDCNSDGIVDSHTTFAEVDNPRGILPIDDRVFVLYTTFVLRIVQITPFRFGIAP